MEKTAYDRTVEEIRERFPGQEVLSLNKVSKYLGIDRRTLLESPGFPALKIGTGTHIRVPVIDLAIWLTGGYRYAKWGRYQ